MKTNKFFCIILSLVAGLWVCGCTQKETDPLVPAPGKPDSKTIIPNPWDSDTPDDPIDPDKPDDPVDPVIVGRLGITPIVAVYFTEYTPEDQFPTFEDIKCFTHINVGHARFVNPKTGDGGLEIKAPGPDYLRRIVGYKAGYPELKVLLVIGGWGKNADGFSEMAKDDTKRALFCSECVRICDEYGLDGVDLDWEYPTYKAKTYLDDGSIYYNGADPMDTENFTRLVRDLREALGEDKLISYAANDEGRYINNRDVLEWVDYINVMTYSMGDPPTRHNSPLFTTSRWPDQNRGGADCIEIFHRQGVPYNRMNYGIGFYGHGTSPYSSSVSYADAMEALEKGTVNGKSVANYNYRHWDDESKSVYLGDKFGKMYASYEDVESIGYRVKWLKEKGMLGAFAWELREDDKKGTLRKALHALMNGEEPIDEPVNPDEPDEPVVALPVMGSVEFSKKLQSGTAIVEELSGLCLSKDGDFLWGCGDNGVLYKINFDGTFSEHWQYDADMEGLCLDPATGTMYMGIEPKRVYKLDAPYTSKSTLFDVAEAADMSNSGIEGIAWHKGNLYLGAQTGATLWEYKLDGTKLWKKSLREVTSTISEIAGLDYDAEKDWLWVIDSNSNKERPEYLGYTVYLFNGDATKLLKTYYVGEFANWNPEALCVDRKNGCIWIADDCGDATPSILHKVKFTNL